MGRMGVDGRERKKNEPSKTASAKSRADFFSYILRSLFAFSWTHEPTGLYVVAFLKTVRIASSNSDFSL